MHKIPIYLKSIDTTITFQKITTREWYHLHREFAPIFEDWTFHMLMSVGKIKQEIDLDLPRVYTALFTLFGPHKNYDFYKSSFAYGFRLKIDREGHSYDYVLSLREIKGNMPYFTYYRRPGEGEDANTYQKPIDTEMSNEDLNLLVNPYNFIHHKICRANFIGKPEKIGQNFDTHHIKKHIRIGYN